MGWKSAVLAGAALVGVLAGCGSAQRSSAPTAPRASGTPSPASSPTAKPSAPGSAGAAAAVVELQSSEQIAFTGDVVTLTVQATASPGSPNSVRLASATVRLGDGTTTTVSGPCKGASLPAPSAGLVVKHTYRQTGVVSPQVTAAALCGQSGAAPNLAGSSVSLRILPAAPADSASWPQCNRSQIAITATSTGAALGHIGVLFTLRNASSADCRLYGYPGLQLLSSNGRPLPTTVVRAVTGAYLFPAVAPHWVAFAAGAVGSFDLQYGDNPTGSAANEPLSTACPPATDVEVTLPNAYDHSVVSASMAPCEGQVLVSPVVPGSQWLSS